MTFREWENGTRDAEIHRDMGIQEIHRDIWVYIGIHRATGGYTRIQGCAGIQKDTQGNKGDTGIHGYTEIHGDTQGYRGIQGYTEIHGDIGIHGDTRLHRDMEIPHARAEADSKRLP